MQVPPPLSKKKVESSSFCDHKKGQAKEEGEAAGEAEAEEGKETKEK